MSQWKDRITNHPVWAQFKSLSPVIDQALAKEGMDAPSIESLERLRAVVIFTEHRLASADASLSDPRTLDKINASLATVLGEVQAFVGDNNASHLTAAQTHADEIVIAAAAVLVPVSIHDLSAINRFVSAFRNTLDKHLSEALAKNQEIKSQSDDSNAALRTLAARIVEESAKIAAVVVEHQKQFAADQTARASEFTSAQTERQTNFTAKTTEFQTLFSTAQTERQEKYSATAGEQAAQFTKVQQERAAEHAEAHQTRQTKFDALIGDYTKKLADQDALFTEQRGKAEKESADALLALKTQHQAEAQRILDAMGVRKSEVEKLVGVIGNLGVTSGYLKTANHARAAMYVWQVLTVVSLGALIYFAYLIAFTPQVPDAAFVQGLATRVFLSITVGVFAAYAARQADKASIAERKNRKLALELEALGPYIAPLPVEMQNKFRADLGERSFGVPDEVGQKAADNSPSPVNAIDLLKSKEGRDLVAEIVKGVQGGKP